VLSPQNFFNTQQLGKKEKNKQTNLPKKYQLRRTRKPTNPNSSANTERGVLPMFCCKGAKGYQGLQTSSSREKTKNHEKLTKKKKEKEKLKSNKQSSEDADWMDGKRRIICRKSSMGCGNGRKPFSSAVSCAKSTFSYNLQLLNIGVSNLRKLEFL
jgi:hypothetical protein